MWCHHLFHHVQSPAHRILYCEGVQGEIHSGGTSGGFTPIPNAMVAIRTRKTEPDLVNDDTMYSFTEAWVPLVYMSTSLNWGRSGYPAGCVNSCFMQRQKSRYNLAHVSCCWQKMIVRPILTLSLQSFAMTGLKVISSESNSDTARIILDLSEDTELQEACRHHNEGS